MQDSERSVDAAVQTMREPPPSAAPGGAGSGPERRGGLFLALHEAAFMVFGTAATLADATVKPLKSLFSSRSRE
jgi:hypothetical protein